MSKEELLEIGMTIIDILTIFITMALVKVSEIIEKVKIYISEIIEKVKIHISEILEMDMNEIKEIIEINISKLLEMDINDIAVLAKDNMIGIVVLMIILFILSRRNKNKKIRNELLKLKEAAKEFAVPYYLSNGIKKYINFARKHNLKINEEQVVSEILTSDIKNDLMNNYFDADNFDFDKVTEFCFIIANTILPLKNELLNLLYKSDFCSNASMSLLSDILLDSNVLNKMAEHTIAHRIQNDLETMSIEDMHLLLYTCKNYHGWLSCKLGYPYSTDGIKTMIFYALKDRDCREEIEVYINNNGNYAPTVFSHVLLHYSTHYKDFKLAILKYWDNYKELAFIDNHFHIDILVPNDFYTDFIKHLTTLKLRDEDKSNKLRTERENKKRHDENIKYLDDVGKALDNRRLW
ncbi:MAG: hypothetical protein DRG78_07225 [Epsilonproteobacteria bacterium]|nr:MAG: hypothetical protein DRG78_07225 [Campylobacterota bacterium]